MAMPNVSLSSPVALPPDDSLLIEARARWNPDLSPAKARPLVRAIEQADAQTLPGLLAQMELLCSVLDAETDPEPELSQRLASKVRVTLQHLVAASAAQAVDPHLAWEREALSLRAEGNTPGLEQEPFDELSGRWNEIEYRIAETPATTLAGIAVQLRLTKLGFADQTSAYAQETALETALATIEGHAGGRA
ncbi:MAG: hypothetical protein WAS21_07110 [Geminicoccaceae bacterium]